MNLVKLYKKIKNFVVTRKEKAVVGFIVSAIGAYLAQSGLTVDQVFSKKGLYSLVVGVLTHIVIYWTPNTEGDV